MSISEPNLASQLAALKRHAMPVATGLRALADDTQRRKMKKQLERLAELVEKGHSLGDALRKLGNRELRPLSMLLDHDVPLETQVRLLTIWDSQQRALRNQATQLRAALWYPMTVAALALIATAWLASLLGDVAQIWWNTFDFGVWAPATWLTGTSAAVRHSIPPLTVLAILVFAVTISVIPKNLRHRLLYSLPVLRPVLRWQLWTGYFRMLSECVAAKVSLQDALPALACQFSHSALRPVLSRLSDAVANGNSLASACRRLRGFPPELIPFLQTASSSAELDAALRAAADVSAERFNVHAVFARRIFPPVLLFCMAVLVATAIGSLGMIIVRFVQALTA